MKKSKKKSKVVDTLINGAIIAGTAGGVVWGNSQLPIPDPGSTYETVKKYVPAVPIVAGVGMLFLDDQYAKSAGAGLLAGGIVLSLHAMGITGTGNTYVNGYSDYPAHDQIINGDFINGLLEDNAVQNPNSAIV